MNSIHRSLTAKLVFILILAINFNTAEGQNLRGGKLRFIDYFIEGATPLNWEMMGDTAIKIFIMYDYERESLNRQSYNWYFRVEADKGTYLKLIFTNIVDIYNGRKADKIGNLKQDIICYVSYDKKSWEGVKMKRLPNMEISVEFTMKGEEVYLAKLPPYTLTDLENYKRKIEKNPYVKIIDIGNTVDKRPLEMIQVGKTNAPNPIIIRARAHSWETAGNYVVEGLINKFTGPGEEAKKWREKYCLYIMPMANKDGVVRGMTRFNTRGKDLNRNWDTEADPLLCPEKYFFEKFLKELISKGRRPVLGLDLHNDDNGSVHAATYRKDDTVSLNKLHNFENLLRKHTWFSEGIQYSWKTESQSQSIGSFQDGLGVRYGIFAMVYEFNANWIASLNRVPAKEDWISLGENLNKVFYDYVNSIEK